MWRQIHKLSDFCAWRFFRVLAFFALVCVGCQTAPLDNFTKVKEDMSKDQVLEILGSPNRTERIDGNDKWSYRFYVGPEKEKEALRQITFRNGRVVSLGEDTEEEKRLDEIKQSDERNGEIRKKREAARQNSSVESSNATETKPAGASASSSTVKEEPQLPDPSQATESDYQEMTGNRPSAKTNH